MECRWRTADYILLYSNDVIRLCSDGRESEESHVSNREKDMQIRPLEANCGCHVCPFASTYEPEGQIRESKHGDMNFALKINAGRTHFKLTKWRQSSI